MTAPLRFRPLLAAFALLGPLVSSGRTVLEAGPSTQWRYRDDGADPGPSWAQPGFDDAAWGSGPAPLGYGDPGLGTTLRWGVDADHKPVTVWFRRTFELPALKPGERLFALWSADDGAALYLNGSELGRVNLPAGPLLPGSTASRALSDRDEGFYRRLEIPVRALLSGTNVLAAEVHQCSPASSDLFFDLALVALPPPSAAAPLREAARPAVEQYLRRHYLGPDLVIPDGYEDGGRRMRLDENGEATAPREILLVDRAKDDELARHLAHARAPALTALPPLDRAQALAAYVDRVTTPPGGIRWLGATTSELESAFAGEVVPLGEWLALGRAGVCRHRALLFKLLGDEAGLKTALVRGNFDVGGAHIWNELLLDDGRRLLVDVMRQRGQQAFREVGSPEVVQHYLKVDNTPWYTPTP